MIENDNTKLARDHYLGDYDKLPSFVSYYYQVDLFRRLDCHNMLEIGIGNKTVSTYLRHHGYDITTCDYNEALQPNHVADIRDLPFDDNSFDVVMACEILEHLPWSDVPKALSQLHRVTKRYAIISLPVTQLFFEVVIKFPLILQIFKRLWFDIFLSVPCAIFKRNSKIHHWEIGLQGFSLRKIRQTFRTRFDIITEARPVLNPRHRFFVLEKKSESPASG